MNDTETNMANPTKEPLMEENNNKPKIKSSTLSLIKEFTEYTSIHGLGRSGGAKYLVQRIAWALLFLAALGMAILQLRELYFKFESRPVSTIIKLTNKATLHFPEVTFCNLNPLHASLLKKLDSNLYEAIINSGKDIGEDETPRPLDDKKDANSTSPEDETEEQDIDDQPTPRTRRSPDDYKKSDQLGNKNNNGNKNNDKRSGDGGNDDGDGGDDDGDGGGDGGNDKGDGGGGDDVNDENGGGGNDDEDDDDGDGGGNDDYDDEQDEDIDDFAMDPSELLMSHKKREVMYQFLSEIDEDIGYKIGHQFDDSVLSCSYRGKDCKNKMGRYWKKFWHHKYGICFSFNGKTHSVKPLKSNKAGPSHGLNLKLFVDQANYMSQFTKMAGYKIVISQQGLMTFPHEEGINVQPGLSSSIGIRKVLIKRADPFKNNSCHDQKRSNKGNLYYENYRTKYSNTACRESCLAYNQRKYCNCTDYRFPPFAEKTPACSLFNITHVKCLRRVTAMFKHNKLNCSMECAPACYEEHFKLSTSYATWPSKKYEEEISKKNNENADKKIRFSDNYLQVQIFFEQLNYEVIEEVVSYGLIDFVSDVGGQLGLWLGVSVLAAAEVVELLLLIFSQLCKKKEKARGKENEKEPIALDDDLELPAISDV